MANRDDITYIQQLSPRVAEIAQPSTEIVMQDYVDTTRLVEDDFQNMGFPFLISASGKEELGGGVLVGITVSEKNLQLAFEPNTTPAHTGTVTTPSGPPNAVGRITFADSSADFVTANVQPGSMVINFTDQSVADVVRVIDSTTLETRTLSNGVDNEFDAADVIHVFNIRQCTTSGGNLVAVDDLGSPIPAILPTAFTQVVLQTSSSATIQELTEIRYATYQNAIWYQAGSGNSGTDYPNGTPLQPLNNWPDVVTLANALGFFDLKVIGDAELTTGDTVPGFRIMGQDPALTTITLQGAADVTGTQFIDCTVTGVLDGDTVIRDCTIQPPLTFVEGTLLRCLIETGTITLGGSSDVQILDSWSGVAGLSTPVIDYGGSGRDLILRNWSGGVEIQNKTGADNASIDLVSGQIILDSTVTAGTFRVAGNGRLVDNSTGTTINNDGLVNTALTAEAVWNSLLADFTTTGTFGEFIARRLLTVAKYFALK